MVEQPVNRLPLTNPGEGNYRTGFSKLVAMKKGGGLGYKINPAPLFPITKKGYESRPDPVAPFAYFSPPFPYSAMLHTGYVL